MANANVGLRVDRDIIRTGLLVPIMVVHDDLICTVNSLDKEDLSNQLRLNPLHRMDPETQTAVESELGMVIRYDREVPIGHIWVQHAEESK